MVLVGLLALQVVQAAGSALGFAAENLSLGFSNILNAPLTIIAALWSLGAAVVIHNILRCLVVISGRMLGKPKPSDMDGGWVLHLTPLTHSYNRRAIMPRAAVSAALLLAVALFVPTGTALAALFIVQLALTSGTSFDDDVGSIHTTADSSNPASTSSRHCYHSCSSSCHSTSQK